MARHQDSKLPGSCPRENPCYKVSAPFHSPTFPEIRGTLGSFPVSAAERCPHRTNHLPNKWYSDKQGGGPTWLHRLLLSIQRPCIIYTAIIPLNLTSRFSPNFSIIKANEYLIRIASRN